MTDFGRARIIDDEALENQTKPSTGVEQDHNIGENWDSIRWSAPEIMDPGRFGFTKDLVAKLPSRSTDIYALGMTILEVNVDHFDDPDPHHLILLPSSQILTGRQPFSRSTDGSIVKKVVDGVRPERPNAGFSDGLWNLLQLSWSAEHESQESKRPSIGLILEQLQKDSSDWFSATKLPFPTIESKRPSLGKWFFCWSSVRLRTKILMHLSRREQSIQYGSG